MITPATTEQLPRIIELLDQADLPTDDLPAPQVDFFVELDARGRIVGAAGLERRGAAQLLRSVVVCPTERGRGVGATLVAAAMASVGSDPTYLLTADAERYFERLGFRAVARDALPIDIQAHPQVTHLCPASATAMELVR